MGFDFCQGHHGWIITGRGIKKGRNGALFTHSAKSNEFCKRRKGGKNTPFRPTNDREDSFSLLSVSRSQLPPGEAQIFHHLITRHPSAKTPAIIEQNVYTILVVFHHLPPHINNGTNYLHSNCLSVLSKTLQFFANLANLAIWHLMEVFPLKPLRLRHQKTGNTGKSGKPWE